MSAARNKSIGRRHLLEGTAAMGALAASQAPAWVTAAAAPSLEGPWLVRSTERTGRERIDLATFGPDGRSVTAGALPLTARATSPGRSTINLSA